MPTVADLRIGQTGRIKTFTEVELSLKLLEMGCLPGAEVKLTAIAPLGDPLCISVMGYQLSLRKEEAETVELQ